ncbi:MAG: Lipopolysaccharide core biosynthesis protein RfaG [Phycisphaerae bacterium]|nr:Lipopolysaccharide core biosynthesis protein RfaG [Phycisphaerae bacterium]
MRIGLVIERMETWRGGAETSTAQFARELVSRGHEVLLFTSSRGVSEPGVEVHTVPVPRTRARRANAFTQAVGEALARTPVDVTHSMTPLFGGDVFMPRGGTVAETVEGNIRIRRSALGRRMKRWLNLFNRRQRSMLALERELLAGANPPRRIVALSQYVAEQLRTHYNLTPPRVVEVFNAVTAPLPSEADRAAARREVRAEWSVPDGELLMLFVAHNFKLKGLGPLLDGLAELNRRQPTRPWRLFVVGRDRPRPYVSAARRLGVAGRVVFTGPTERVARFYLAGDLLVLPTFYDPCSRVVLEAVSLGTPAVTSRFNGAGEALVASGGRAAAGCVVRDPHDAVELASAIERYFDPSARAAAAEAGIALRPRLSMARHADEMIAIYREIAK